VYVNTNTYLPVNVCADNLQVVQILLYLFVSNELPKPPQDARLENGRPREVAERQARDADEFELQGLITDDEASDAEVEERKP
jgi:hypothetical protein